MTIDQGIILTGGRGTRLMPLTDVISKHLITVGDKFVIDYPLQTLKNSGVKDLIVVLGSDHFEQIVKYLKDGQKWGMNVSYIHQNKSDGIAAAINLCKAQLKNCDQFLVALGDNFFEKQIKWSDKPGAEIVLDDYKCNGLDIEHFGVATLTSAYNGLQKIEEKPSGINFAKFNYPITGFYKFDQKYFEYFKNLNPSKRGEFEITGIIEQYWKDNTLNLTWHQGLWSDLGTFNSIANINNYLYSKK